MADPGRIEAARRLLLDVTPLAFDCGTLCGHRCCTDFAPDEGIYLLPGELALFDGTEEFPSWQFHRTDEYECAPSWEERHDHLVFMQCKQLCVRQRAKRPFECRTYPLAPYLHPDGRLEMRFNFLAEGICPLLVRYRVDQLEPAFVAAAHQAWTLLLEEAEMVDHVRWLSAQFDALALPRTSLTDEEEAASSSGREEKG